MTSSGAPASWPERSMKRYGNNTKVEFEIRTGCTIQVSRMPAIGSFNGDDRYQFSLRLYKNEANNGGFWVLLEDKQVPAWQAFSAYQGGVIDREKYIRELRFATDGSTVWMRARIVTRRGELLFAEDRSLADLPPAWGPSVTERKITKATRFCNRISCDSDIRVRLEVPAPIHGLSILLPSRMSSFARTARRVRGKSLTTATYGYRPSSIVSTLRADR